MFAAGFLLGPLRVLWLAPRVGARTAELVEAPLMLVVIVLAGRWVGRRFGLPARPGRLLGVGLLAVGLVLVADVVVGVALRGMTVGEVFADRDLVSGAVYYGLLTTCALVPWLLGGRAPARS